MAIGVLADIFRVSQKAMRDKETMVQEARGGTLANPSTRPQGEKLAPNISSRGNEMRLFLYLEARKKTTVH